MVNTMLRRITEFCARDNERSMGNPIVGIEVTQAQLQIILKKYGDEVYQLHTLTPTTTRVCGVSRTTYDVVMERSVAGH